MFTVKKPNHDPILILDITGKTEIEADSLSHMEAVDAALKEHNLDHAHLIVHCPNVNYTFADVIKLTKVHTQGRPGSASDARLTAYFVSSEKVLKLFRDMVAKNPEASKNGHMPMFTSLDEAGAFILERLQFEQSKLNKVS